MLYRLYHYRLYIIPLYSTVSTVVIVVAVYINMCICVLVYSPNNNINFFHNFNNTSMNYPCGILTRVRVIYIIYSYGYLHTSYLHIRLIC